MNKKNFDTLIKFLNERDIDLDSNKAIYITRRYQKLIKTRRG